MTNLAQVLCLVGFACGAVIGAWMFSQTRRRIWATFTRRQRELFVFAGPFCAMIVSMMLPTWLGFSFSTGGLISATLWGWSGVFFLRLMIAHKEMP